MKSPYTRGHVRGSKGVTVKELCTSPVKGVCPYEIRGLKFRAEIDLFSMHTQYIRAVPHSLFIEVRTQYGHVWHLTFFYELSCFGAGLYPISEILAFA